MKAVVRLDVPDWQIGQDVTVYFPDTMVKHCKCEMMKEQEAVEPKVIRMNAFGHPVHACGKCGYLITESMNYCSQCGQAVKWD